jgi:uncharacterized protein YjbI with pentapeptide repeats
MAPSRKWIIVIAVAVLVIGFVVAWWWSSIVEGLRSLWHGYIARREYLAPLVPLISNLLTVLVALGAAWIALARHFAQTGADTQRRITETITKAVEQLGSKELPVRLGGIYTLERVSRESKADYWPIMEILTGFVRERARWGGPAPLRKGGMPTDIAAVLVVINRRDKNQKNFERERQSREWKIDLNSTDLRGAMLYDAKLEGAFLRGAHLEGAVLVDANLVGANLYDAHLEEARLSSAHLDRAHLVGAVLAGANLYQAVLIHAHLDQANLEGADLYVAQLEGALLPGANLEGANLNGANLEGARLYGANLDRANLEGANLNGAYLEGARLITATGLMKSQLDKTSGDAKTRLPEGVERPAHWPPFEPHVELPKSS